MGDINRANIESAFTNFDAIFTNAFQQNMDASIAPAIAEPLESTSSTEDHKWLTQLPFMREWLGDRQVKDLESGSLAIKNRKFESTISIDVDDVEDDKIGLYDPLVRILASNAADLWPSLLKDTLVTNDNWVDGAAFFGTARSYDGSSTISNYSTTTFSEAQFDDGFEKMTSYVGHEGKELGVEPYALVFGPKNRKLAYNILKNRFSGVGTGGTTDYVHGDNANMDIVQPVMWNKLVGTYDDYVFLLGRCAGIKGLAYQIRKEPETTGITDPENEHVFKNDEYLYGVKARGAAFKALPHCIYAWYV